MRHILTFILPMLLLAPSAQAKQVKAMQPLAIPKGQPLRITGMDLAFAPEMQSVLGESDAKAARKRAEAGLPPLDRDSYPTSVQDGARYATMPFKQMFPLVIRDVARDWKLTQGTPVKLRIMLDRYKTADAAMAILIASSSDMLEGTVDVIDATNGGPLGSFRVEVRNTQSGWAGMLMRGGGVREKLAEEFGLELSRYLSGARKKPS